VTFVESGAGAASAYSVVRSPSQASISITGTLVVKPVSGVDGNHADARAAEAVGGR